MGVAGGVFPVVRRIITPECPAAVGFVHVRMAAVEPEATAETPETGGTGAGPKKLVNRYMNAAMASRLTVVSARYDLEPLASVQPVLIPVEASQAISL